MRRRTMDVGSIKQASLLSDALSQMYTDSCLACARRACRPLYFVQWGHHMSIVPRIMMARVRVMMAQSLRLTCTGSEDCIEAAMWCPPVCKVFFLGHQREPRGHAGLKCAAARREALRFMACGRPARVAAKPPAKSAY